MDPEPFTKPPCAPSFPSCGANEIWSFGEETQTVLERYVRLRALLQPYIAELSANVSSRGVPAVRPLWWDFPHDVPPPPPSASSSMYILSPSSASSFTSSPLSEAGFDIDDQFLLGPDILVAPVSVQGATRRFVYFPSSGISQNEEGGTVRWINLFNSSDVVEGGQWQEVEARLEIIPAYKREGGAMVLDGVDLWPTQRT